MTPAEFKSIYNALGFRSQGQLAKLLGVSGDRTIRYWEDGERSIPGPVALIMRALRDVPELRKHIGLAD